MTTHNPPHDLANVDTTDVQVRAYDVLRDLGISRGKARAVVGVSSKNLSCRLQTAQNSFRKDPEGAIARWAQLETERKQEMVAAQRERERERSMRQTAWAAYLTNLGLSEHPLAKELTACLVSPVAANPAWFREALAAMQSNIDTNGRASREAEAEGWSYELVTVALKAHRRHSGTNYDALLAQGATKDEAREAMQ